jgi:hypothetical protein
MIDRDQFLPTRTAHNSEPVTWPDHQHDEQWTSPPECAAHHTSVPTVPVEAIDAWVCPSCGRLSDAYTDHSGGTHLIAPREIDAHELILVVGEAVVPPSEDRNSPFGDELLDAVLVATPYAAKEDLKAFKSDAEWPQPPRRFRRWVPEWSVWAVRRTLRDEFVDHMIERDWIAVDIPAVRRRGAERHD